MSLGTLVPLNINNTYENLPIQQRIQRLEEECKMDYIKPMDMPYHRNMARKFPYERVLSQNDVKKKQSQAESSRLSRDKKKYLRGCMKHNISALTKVLEAHISQFTQMKSFMEAKVGPDFDWDALWDDKDLPLLAIEDGKIKKENSDDEDPVQGNPNDVSVQGECSNARENTVDTAPTVRPEWMRRKFPLPLTIQDINHIPAPKPEPSDNSIVSSSDDNGNSSDAGSTSTHPTSDETHTENSDEDNSSHASDGATSNPTSSSGLSYLFANNVNLNSAEFASHCFNAALNATFNEINESHSAASTGNTYYTSGDLLRLPSKKRKISNLRPTMRLNSASSSQTQNSDEFTQSNDFMPTEELYYSSDDLARLASTRGQPNNAEPDAQQQCATATTSSPIVTANCTIAPISAANHNYILADLMRLAHRLQTMPTGPSSDPAHRVDAQMLGAFNKDGLPRY